MKPHPPHFLWTAQINGETHLALRKLSGFLERGRGLLGYAELPDAHGYYFPSCRSIHTWFMPVPIDAIALDANHVVVAILPDLQPWRMPKLPKATRHLIELRSGEASRLGLTEALHLQIVPAS